MKTRLFSTHRLVNRAFRLLALLALTTTSGWAAATLTQQIDPPEINLGDSANISITVQNGSARSIAFPQVDGLQVAGQSTSTGFNMINGVTSTSFTEILSVVPQRAGDFTIPAFDVTTQEGTVLRTQPMKLHVLSSATAPSSTTPTVPAVPIVPNPSPAPAPSPAPVNPNGPVVMPPNNSAPANNPSNGSAPDTSNSTFTPPLDTDGRPAKVFVVVTLKTTDAYVGETIPMRIEWYIRADVSAQQDSLPTIKGSDFLLNDLSPRPQQDNPVVNNETYQRYSWVTGVTAPKTGDFPLQMECDSYWVASFQNVMDPFGNIFGRQPKLAHESIPSNLLTVHVHSLPDEGRPADFSGAIGQLKVTGDATPTSVNVGEPITVTFTISGTGNFSYVKCPTLATDPAWKSYVPSSKINYDDESHTEGTKTFEQALIPQKNGTLPLPAATFTYFDPATKQYVSTPIALPEITVNGTAPVLAAAPSGSSDSASAGTGGRPASDFLPNRVELGYLQTSLAPAYRQPWFWAVQGGLGLIIALGGFFSVRRSRVNPDNGLAERMRNQQLLHQQSNAMSEAVRHGDSRAFFLAARHTAQLQLGVEWRLKPEAITLDEIRKRDPQRAELMEPLFSQADEIIYSGQAPRGLDLVEWERRVREEMLQSQLASS